MSWIKPKNRHKYEKMDYSRKPGEPGKVMQWVLLLLATLIGVPLFFAFILGLWYIAAPLMVVVAVFMAYAAVRANRG